MEAKLQQYLNSLFEEAPKTAKTVELKEEMLQNLLEKYRDLLRSGKTEQEAVEIACNSVGDVKGLFRQLEMDSPENRSQLEARRKKSAGITAIAVMMYILAAIPLFLAEIWDQDETVALIFTLVIVAAATGLLIYDGMTKPHYKAQDENVVEQFREWQSGNTNVEIARKAVKSAMWSIIVALYFIITFTTWKFHITWVIFLIGGAISSLIDVWFSSRRE